MRRSCKADLVVHNHMHGTTSFMANQAIQAETFRDNNTLTAQAVSPCNNSGITFVRSSSFSCSCFARTLPKTTGFTASSEGFAVSDSVHYCHQIHRSDDDAKVIFNVA